MKPLGKRSIVTGILALSFFSGIMFFSMRNKPESAVEARNKAAAQEEKALPEKKVSATRQVYLDAINEYNAFASRKTTMKQFEAKHGSFEGDRGQALCYLAANLMAASMKDPDLWTDKNDDLEGKEWAHWRDVSGVELKCGRYAIKPDE